MSEWEAFDNIGLSVHPPVPKIFLIKLLQLNELYKENNTLMVRVGGNALALNRCHKLLCTLYKDSQKGRGIKVFIVYNSWNINAP